MAPVDPLKIATTLPGKMATIVADTASTGAIQDTIKTEGDGNSKTSDTKPTQNQAETIFVASGNQSIHASGNRTTTQKSSGQKSYSSNDRVNKDLSKLLSGGATVVDDDAFEDLVRYAKPADRAIANVYDKYNPLPKGFIAEQNKALLAFNSGAITQPNGKKLSDLEDKKFPLQGSSSENSEEEPNIISYTKGKVINEKAEIGKLYNMYA